MLTDISRGRLGVLFFVIDLGSPRPGVAGISALGARRAAARVKGDLGRKARGCLPAAGDGHLAAQGATPAACGEWRTHPCTPRGRRTPRGIRTCMYVRVRLRMHARMFMYVCACIRMSMFV